MVVKNASSGSLPTIYATDLTPNKIKEVEKRPGLESVKSEVMDSEGLMFPDEMFTHSITSMLHPTTLRPDVVTKEIFRTTRTGGVALSAQFIRYGRISFTNYAIRKIRPDAPPFTGPVSEDWKTVDWFRS